MTVSTYIGTSGWHYDHWVGAFHPQDLPDGAFFEYYANYFGTAEINNSFYRLPEKQTLARWAGAFSTRLKEGLDVCFYFDNDEAGYAVQDALMLQQMTTEG